MHRMTSALSHLARPRPLRAAAARLMTTQTQLVNVQHDVLPSGVPSGVAIVSFNSPASLNNLTVAMGGEFEATMGSLSLAPTLRCVVLTGQGKSFSAGGDLKFLQDRASDQPINNAVTMRAFYKRFLSLRTLPVPVIAAINGSAIGAGFAVALACDLRLYADDAKVGLTFTQLGLHPGMGSTHFLPELVGHEKAARLLLTGDVISGPDAVAMGLGLSAAPSHLLLPHALELARKIAANSSSAVRTVTRSLRMRSEVGLEAALQREADAQAQTYAMSDYREGLSAILDKRKPDFYKS